jgi:hypothetical protein
MTSHDMLTAYREEDYVLSAQLFREQADVDWTFASLYADICMRDLDGAGHTLEEGVKWYWAAAQVGDGDAISWILSLFGGAKPLAALTYHQVLDAVREQLS